MPNNLAIDDGDTPSEGPENSDGNGIIGHHGGLARSHLISTGNHNESYSNENNGPHARGPRGANDAAPDIVVASVNGACHRRGALSDQQGEPS